DSQHTSASRQPSARRFFSSCARSSGCRAGMSCLNSGSILTAGFMITSLCPSVTIQGSRPYWLVSLLHSLSRGAHPLRLPGCSFFLPVRVTFPCAFLRLFHPSIDHASD